MNVCNFVGRLTRDPELKTTKGDPVVKFALAVQGFKKEDVTFVECEAWGKRGETIHQYLKKGDMAAVSCRFKVDKWEGKDGEKKSAPRFVVENFTFCGGKRENEVEENEETVEPVAVVSEDTPF